MTVARDCLRRWDRLHRSSRRLIWLNPLLRYDEFQPKSQGIRAILPHVDEFRPVHNLESLAQLAHILSNADAVRDPSLVLAGDGGMSELTMDAHENILEEAASWRAKGRDVAIATVVKT